MKNKKLMVVILSIVLLMSTGCGSKDYIKDKEGKIVTSNGQSLQKNIFCRPSEGTEIYSLYEQYESQMSTKLSKLPECKDFSITSNKTKSLWQFVFVKPLAYLILKLGYLFKSAGMTKAYLALSLMVIGLLIRLIILPFNIKTQNQSKKMQEIMPEIQRIEKKYANRTDQESMILKSQETMAVYSKYKINPMLSCVLALIQLPIFFAFLQAIYKIPAIYEGEIFGWGLGTTPSVGIFTNHQYSYIIIVILIILTTYFSFKYSMSQTSVTTANNEAAKQMNTMVMVMTLLVAFTSFSLPTAIALYWIVTYAFIVIQTFVMKKLQSKKTPKKVRTTNSTKNIKTKLKEKDGMKYGKNS